VGVLVLQDHPGPVIGVERALIDHGRHDDCDCD
jgi:hypothetical protein